MTNFKHPGSQTKISASSLFIKQSRMLRYNISWPYRAIAYISSVKKGSTAGLTCFETTQAYN
jgi:hypothetical protein